MQAHGADDWEVQVMGAVLGRRREQRPGGLLRIRVQDGASNCERERGFRGLLSEGVDRNGGDIGRAMRALL